MATPETEKMTREGEPYNQEQGSAEIIPEAVEQLHPGLHLYAPVAADMDVKGDTDIAIVGTGFHQMLQIVLAPGDMITCEPGSMVMMSGLLKPDIESGGCGPACRRCCCAGESLFRLVFENKTSDKQFIAVSPPQPGKIIPINLETFDGITLRPGSFLGAIGRDWDYRIKTVNNLGTGCCGGQGFFLSELHGSGTAFIHAMGTVEILTLQEGEKMVLEQSSLVAFEKGVHFDVRQTGGCLICCCGGMGLFNSVLTGPGRVIVQSLSIDKLRAAIGVNGGGGGGGGGDGGGGN